MSTVGHKRTIADLARAAGDLLVGIDGDPGTVVTDLAYDSRRVGPGELFFCIPGLIDDGHRYAGESAAAGAVALCVERPTDQGLVEIRVSDARRALARIAGEWFGRPADSLRIVGITGTNGKTTTAYLVRAILEHAGHHPGLIGTIETRIGDQRRPGVRTTPESLDLQALLAEMVSSGVDSVAMEVTSHGLALGRIEGLRFAAAAFTNLSQDHLDFHSGMEDYFEAKRSLFVPERTDAAAVNFDDPYGRRLIESGIPTLGFGTASDAHVRPERVTLKASQSEFIVATPSGEIKVTSSLVGAFNVLNCLAAAAVALQAGIELDAIEAALSSEIAVPGRFEAIDESQPFTVVVDYAHTPDSLDNVLRAARNLAGEGRVVCVFGCGGDRDPLKRPLMGAVVARLADVVIVTSDNPRSEDPNKIIEAILEGVQAERAEGADFVTSDRAEAIDEAIAHAQPGDVVVIAGKGHEKGQEFADRIVPFDDRDVARNALRSAGWGTGS